MVDLQERLARATSELTGVHLEKVRCALGISQERMHCDVIQSARTESTDDMRSLINSEVEGIGAPSHMYLIGIDTG
jgi:hypothetical protein